MSLTEALRITVEAERTLANALLDMSRRHASEPDICETTRLLAGWSRDHARVLVTDRGRLVRPSARLEWRLRRARLEGVGKDGVELLPDLLGLTSCVALVEACWTIVLQAALASHDPTLENIARACGAETLRQRAWLDTKLSQLAPQALTVAPRELSGRPPASMSPHEVPPTILAGGGRKRTGNRVITAPADFPGVRSLAAERHRGLRGPTRTARLRDS
jgi:hypothetical protein